MLRKEDWYPFQNKMPAQINFGRSAYNWPLYTFIFIFLPILWSTSYKHTHGFLWLCFVVISRLLMVLYRTTTNSFPGCFTCTGVFDCPGATGVHLKVWGKSTTICLQRNVWNIIHVDDQASETIYHRGFSCIALFNKSLCINPIEFKT